MGLKNSIELIQRRGSVEVRRGVRAPRDVFPRKGFIDLQLTQNAPRVEKREHLDDGARVVPDDV